MNNGSQCKAHEFGKVIFEPSRGMRYPVTPAIRVLRKKKIEFEPFLFDYVEKGGTSHSAAELGVTESSVVKTLVFETNENKPFIVLMRGHMVVSTKNLARHMGVKSVASVTPEIANRLTGYVVGGTSPFGLKTQMPVYAEESIFDLETIYINGGKRGFLVGLEPSALNDLLELETVSVGIERAND